MAHTAKRFLFEEDFSAQISRNTTRDEQKDSASLREEIAASDARFEEGRALGHAEAQAMREAEAVQALASIRDTMQVVAQSLDRELARIEADSISMAAMLAKLYAEALIERDPSPMIAEAVQKSIEMSNNAPLLTVIIAANAPEDVHSAIREAADDVGFLGQMSIREDAALAAGDVRIVWPEGGFLRERARLDAVVRTLIEMEVSKVSDKAGETA
jgi:flagellar assembly protein FliH